jgi:hypothetical protein
VPGGHSPFGTRAKGLGGRAIDPLSLPGLELYLRSDLGIVAADGDPVASWADQSGHARNASQVTAAMQPTFHRTGPTLSPAGKPAVSFDGLASPNGDNMTGTFPLGQISSTNGATFYQYARVAASVNGAGGQVIFQDDTGGRPQLRDNNFDPPNGFAFRDATGVFDLGIDTLPAIHLNSWVFVPPAPTGLCTLFVNGAALGSHAWNYDNAGTAGYVVGANQVQNVACKMDLWVILWFSVAHDTGTRKGVELFLRRLFG